MTTTEWGPWLDWDGSAEMPPGVARRDRVYIETRDTWEDACGFVESWVWLHTVDESAQDDGIIRYRLRADHPVYGSRKTVRHVGLFIELHEYKTGHAFLLNKRHIAAVQADRNVGGSWVTMPPIGEEDWSYHVSESYKHISAAMADIPLPEAVTVQGEVSDG